MLHFLLQMFKEIYNPDHNFLAIYFVSLQVEFASSIKLHLISSTTDFVYDSPYELPNDSMLRKISKLGGSKSCNFWLAN